jgi:ion channel
MREQERNPPTAQSFGDRLLIALGNLTVAQLIASFAAAVIAFAVAYFFLSPIGHGLSLTYATERPVASEDCLYFSIVTISSLGYGDIRACGYSRLLAGAEVLCGMAYLGVIVARLASAKQEQLLRRLYGSDVFEKLQEFRQGYLDLLERYREHFQSLYHVTPLDSTNRDFVSSQQELRGINYRLRIHTVTLNRHLESERTHGEIVLAVSARTLGSPLHGIRELLRSWRALKEPECDAFRETTGEPNLRDLLSLLSGTADVVDKLSDNPHLHERCESLRSAIRGAVARFRVAESKDSVFGVRERRWTSLTRACTRAANRGGIGLDGHLAAAG